MRNGFVIILLLIGSVVFAQGENKTDSKGLKQGEWKKYHKNGTLRYVGNFTNDKPVGEFKYYYDTGKVQSKMTHTNNGSYSITYHKEGGPQSIGKYVNQEKDSTWFYYDLDGYKIASDYFINGEKNRVSFVYFQSGKIAEEKSFLNDFEQGEWNKFWESGKKKLTATYEKGGLEGKAVYHNSLGNRSISGYYYHGLRNGVWIYFEEDGITIKKKEEYNNGTRVYENKGENIETEPLKPISEDFLNPDNFTSPR